MTTMIKLEDSPYACVLWDDDSGLIANDHHKGVRLELERDPSVILDWLKGLNERHRSIVANEIPRLVWYLGSELPEFREAVEQEAKCLGALIRGDQTYEVIYRSERILSEYCAVCDISKTKALEALGIS